MPSPLPYSKYYFIGLVISLQENEIKKRYLKQYLELKNLVEQEAEDAGYWKEIATSVSATKLDLSGVRSHNVSNYNPIDKFLEIAERCAELGELAQAKKEEIQQAIFLVDDANCRIVLEMRYLRGLQFFEIAKRMRYSLDNIFKLHRKALELFEVPKVYS